MVEEKASACDEPVTEVAQNLDPNHASIEATVESAGIESTNNNNAAEESAVTEEEEREKTIELADELTQKGSVFLKDCDFAEAVDCFSRALEIRVEHYGELAFECVNAYYKYGSALLEKAQAEADPLGNMPKKDGGEEAQQESITKNIANGESVAASVVSSDRQGSSSGGQEGCDGKEEGEDGEDDDISDADADDESDLDMAWKMLDIARAITDKHSTDTMEKVDILSALAEISLEREDIESSLSDYKKALSILERLVEPDSRHITEQTSAFACLETGCQTKEAIPYCQKAILICKSRMERLTNEVKCPSGTATSSAVSEIDQGIQQSSDVPCIDDKSASEKEAEIRTLSGLAEELEKKLEDLKHQAENPNQLLAELMGMASAKASASDKAVATAAGEMSSSRMGTGNTGKDLESPTVSTTHTGAGGGGGASSGVTHLGVVGRGVKRVLMNAESSPSKKLAPESSDKAADGNSS